MSRQVSRAESWEKVYEAFQTVNFSSFDYNSVKQSLLDYVKLYFPEDFNDYIESSEFIAILELFAYIAEVLAYRFDLNAHENFLTTAQRKESVLRLARLISYSPSRNLPARGLVKITSVKTTENVYDSFGRNLANRKVTWSDAANPYWKEQFILVMNRVLLQKFGSVNPQERVQVGDVLLELYNLNNTPLSTAGVGEVFKYTAITENGTYPMELVPASLTADGPIEKRPEVKMPFTILYANDGLGDGSDTTGFLIFTKQGTLQRFFTVFDGVTPNQTVVLNNSNINDTDIWVNNVNPTTGEIIVENPMPDIIERISNNETSRYGEWVEVDLANAQNIIFNTNENRRKYELETLNSDSVRVVFGDGEFADIPSGYFHVWYRVSANENVIISKNSVQNITASFSYVDTLNQVQTLSFTFSLTSSLVNSSASEDMEHIRRIAPSVYYTQDRMVNGRDYNMFMLQDPSILKLRAVNRTFAGDSKYLAWHDPKEYYENVKIFGDDLAIYYAEENPVDGVQFEINSPISGSDLLTNYLQPLLSTTDFFLTIGPEFSRRGANLSSFRTSFNNDPLSFSTFVGTATLFEREELIKIIDEASTLPVSTIDFFYSVVYDEWTAASNPGNDIPPVNTGHAFATENVADPNYIGNANPIWMMRITALYSGSFHSGWVVEYRTKKLIVHSETTKFWHNNEGNKIITYDTLNSKEDIISVLAANIHADGHTVIGRNINFQVLSQIPSDVDLGLSNIHSLSVIQEDINGDNIPDELYQPDLFDMTYIVQYPDDNRTSFTIDLPRTFVIGKAMEEMSVMIRRTNNTTGVTSYHTPIVGEWGEATPPLNTLVNNQIIVTQDAIDPPLGRSSDDFTDEIEVTIYDFVYLRRDAYTEPWEVVAPTDGIKTQWAVSQSGVVSQESYNNRLYDRRLGRSGLNFLWMHRTPRYHLIDPSATNIIDSYIITKGYFESMRSWIASETNIKPTEPSSLDLRTSYSRLLDNKMISDTVILHSGRFKVLFGPLAAPQLQAKFKVIRSNTNITMTDNEVKVKIIEIIRSFFDINQWEFGETFFFSELSAIIHSELGPEIDSIVLVPQYSANQFGDLIQITAREDELFIPDVSTANVEIVSSYTPQNLRLNYE